MKDSKQLGDKLFKIQDDYLEELRSYQTSYVTLRKITFALINRIEKGSFDEFKVPFKIDTVFYDAFKKTSWADKEHIIPDGTVIYEMAEQILGKGPWYATVHLCSIVELSFKHTLRILGNNKPYSTQLDKLPNAFQKFGGFDLKSIPQFMQYSEMRHRRNTHLHNSGLADQTYIKFAKNFNSVSLNDKLIIDDRYYSDSYKNCYKLLRTIMDKLNDKFPSQEYNREYNPKAIPLRSNPAKSD